MLIALPVVTQAQRALERPQGRQQLEQALQERFASVVRRELILDDAGMQKLAQANRNFEQPRRELMRRERQARQGLRAELASSDSGDPRRVEQYMDEMLRVQRERLELHEQEDKSLREFLTPVQRARYYGLQEQLRQRVQQLQRQKRLGADSAAPMNRRRLVRP